MARVRSRHRPSAKVWALVLASIAILFLTALGAIQQASRVSDRQAAAMEGEVQPNGAGRDRPAQYVTFEEPPRSLKPSDSLTAEDRVLSFDILAEAISEYYAHFELKGIAWDAVVARYRPRVPAEQPAESFYLLLWQLVNELRDGHSWLIGYSPPQMAFAPPIELAVVGDRVAVAATPPGFEPDRAGLEPGMEIVSVDGLSPRDWVERNRSMLKAQSTEHGFLYASLRHALSGPGNTRVAVDALSRSGRSVHAELARTTRTVSEATPALRTRAFPLSQGTTVSYGRLASGFGYVAVASLADKDGNAAGSEFDVALQALRHTRGLVIAFATTPAALASRPATSRGGWCRRTPRRCRRSDGPPAPTRPQAPRTRSCLSGRGATRSP